MLVHGTYCFEVIRIFPSQQKLAPSCSLSGLYFYCKYLELNISVPPPTLKAEGYSFSSVRPSVRPCVRPGKYLQFHFKGIL